MLHVGDVRVKGVECLDNGLGVPQFGDNPHGFALVLARVRELPKLVEVVRHVDRFDIECDVFECLCQVPV